MYEVSVEKDLEGRMVFASAERFSSSCSNAAGEEQARK